jgi:D-glycero-alpha-D-manno-heptose-7-phosphate kinase
LRIGLAGGGTDVAPYCDLYGGCVLSATIDRYATTTITPRNDGMVSFVASDLGREETLEAKTKLPTEEGLRLHRGVYNRITELMGKPLSFTMTTSCDAPMGSGLGSSSTIVVSMLAAMAEWLDLPWGEYDIAHLAYETERVDLALQGGKQDQYAAAFGGINFTEFAADNRVIVNPLRLKESVRCEFESRMLIYFTGISRESASIIKQQSDNARGGNVRSLDALHALKADAYEFKKALLTGHFNDIANILNRSWESKKRTATGIANPVIDLAWHTAMQAGARAGKVSGAGGGGFMFFLCDPERRPTVLRALESLGGRASPIHFTSSGAHSWNL